MTTSPPLPHLRWGVTGGTGLLGNNLVRFLVAAGADVRVLSRNAPRREFAGLAVTEIEGDLDDVGALQRLMEGAGCVVHAAAMVDIRFGDRERFEAVNVRGTANVLAALPVGARLVHVSTVDALGMRSREEPADEDCLPQPHEAGVPYVDTKRAADVLVQQSAADWIIVYPTYMLGPWDWRPSSGRMVVEISHGKGKLAPGGGNNFVHVGDVVDALVTASGKPRGGRWILGNENLSYVEAWALMAAVTGAAPPLGPLPRWVGSTAAVALDAVRATGVREGDINAASVRMSFLPHFFSAERARRELGMRQTPVREAIEAAWAFLGPAPRLR
ncbi:MAG: NAD-dependent epimerase/dehydratase family protein [Myxococcales bacterium]|nr:NAD-dependent epimerase/dehydratase family protein [Myxococcales bacterium]